MPESAAPELLERGAERHALLSQLDAARFGDGGVAVVHGPAGAGKSALLGDLRAHAEHVRVRFAVAGELEREFAFGVVHQLLDPLVRSATPTARAALLTGSSAAAAPLFGEGDTAAPVGAADTSFAVLHGLYWLTATLADTEPLLLIVDDLQWADEPSLRFCDFLARRASELPLVLVLAVRTGERRDVDDLVGDIPAALHLELPELTAAATRTIIDAAVGEPVGDDVAAAAHTSTGGNPLLVTELARALGRWDGVPTVGVVEAAVPSSIARSVGRRLRRLTEPAARVAGMLAVLGDALAAEHLAELAGLERIELIRALEELTAAGFVQGEPPQFVHALIRQAVAETASANDRGVLHAQAAGTLQRLGAPQEQVVTHLLAAPPIGEQWAAELLRTAGARAAHEGAADLAVRRFRRALQEQQTDIDPKLFVELGMAELAAGDPQALEHLQIAMRAPQPEVAASAAAMLITIAAGVPPLAADALARSRALLDGGALSSVAAEALEQACLSALSFAPSSPSSLRRFLKDAGAQTHPGTLPMRALHLAGVGAERDAVATVARKYFEGEANLGLPGLEGATRGALSSPPSRSMRPN